MVRDTLEPHFLVELESLFAFAGLLRAFATVCVLLSDRYVDQIHCTKIHGLGYWRGLSIAFVNVARSVFVVVFLWFEQWDRTAIVEICDVWFRVQILSGDVAIIGCL